MLPDIHGDNLKDYLEALRSSHEVSVSAEVYTSDDVLLERYDADNLPIIEGQVDVDDEAEIKRQLMLSLANVSETSTDPGSPGSALQAKRQLRVLYSVLVPHEDGTSDWVDVDVFYGPITRVKRGETTVEVEAQSKETFLLPPNRLLRSLIPNEDDTRTVETEDGERVVTVEEDSKITSYHAGALIKTLAKRHGETRLRVPRGDRKLPEDAKLFDRASQETGVWPLMVAIAGPKQLLYTADGWLTLRTRRQNNPAWVFKDGNDGTVISAPVVEWDMTTFRNVVELRAFQKKQGNEKENPTLRVVVSLENSHPLSPRSLARKGHPRELVEVIASDDVYADGAQARNDARAHLERIAHEALNVSFDCFPIPHLEPGDLVALDLDGQRRTTFAARKFTLPLTPGTMSMGYNRKVRYH